MSHNPILWKPAQEQIEKSQLESFRKQVNMRFNIDIKNYTDLHKWSVNNIEDFFNSTFPMLTEEFPFEVSKFIIY